MSLCCGSNPSLTGIPKLAFQLLPSISITVVPTNPFLHRKLRRLPLSYTTFVVHVVTDPYPHPRPQHSYYLSIGVMMALIVPTVPLAALGLSWDLGRTKRGTFALGDVFKNFFNVNMLSAARFFLFGSRDLWFEVTLPFFLRSAASGIGWSCTLVGILASFMTKRCYPPCITYDRLREHAGTLLSGFLYTFAGDNTVTSFGWCFVASVAFAVLSSVLAVFINDHQGGLALGPCLQIVPKQPAPNAQQADTELAAVAADKPVVAA